METHAENTVEKKLGGDLVQRILSLDLRPGSKLDISGLDADGIDTLITELSKGDEADPEQMARLHLPSGSLVDIAGLTEQGMQKILEMLPQDVRLDMATGGVGATDKGFLESARQHILEKIAPANATGKQVRKKVKEVMSGLGGGTIQNKKEATGRNDPCPCRSGKKYKQCCIHKKR